MFEKLEIGPKCKAFTAVKPAHYDGQAQVRSVTRASQWLPPPSLMGMHTSEAKQKLRGLGFNPKSRPKQADLPFPDVLINVDDARETSLLYRGDVLRKSLVTEPSMLARRTAGPRRS
jgi:hypothetical protein